MRGGKGRGKGKGSRVEVLLGNLHDLVVLGPDPIAPVSQGITKMHANRNRR